MSRKKSRSARSSKNQTTNPLTDRRIQIGLAVSILIAVIAIIFIVMGGDDSTTAGYITLDVSEAYARYTESDNAIIVDVREPYEWEETGIPAGAVPYSLTSLQQVIPAEETLPKDKEIFVICRSGNRSQEASQILIDAGYTDVINIDGGVNDWIANDLPIEAYAP